MRSPINRKSTRTADSMLVTARQALWPYLQAYTAHMDSTHGQGPPDGAHSAVINTLFAWPNNMLHERRKLSGLVRCCICTAPTEYSRHQVKRLASVKSEGPHTQNGCCCCCLRDAVGCGCQRHQHAADRHKRWVISCPLVLCLFVVSSVPVPAMRKATVSTCWGLKDGPAAAAGTLTLSWGICTAAASARRYTCEAHHVVKGCCSCVGALQLHNALGVHLLGLIQSPEVGTHMAHSVGGASLAPILRSGQHLPLCCTRAAGMVLLEQHGSAAAVVAVARWVCQC